MEISDRLATDIKARFGHRPAMGAQHYLEQWIAVTGLTQQEVGDKAGAVEGAAPFLSPG